MIDRFGYAPDRLFLTETSCHSEHTISDFDRWSFIGAKTKRRSIVLSFLSGDLPIVRVSSHRLDDGRWWIRRIIANLPSLLRGHNGHVITSQYELALALTRLQHILKLVIEPSDWHRLIPAVGCDNQSYLNLVECFVQFNDPGQAFVRASHTAKMPNQQGENRVYFSQSTYGSKREFCFSTYDKLRQVRHGIADPQGAEPTRVEIILRDEERLAKEAHAANELTGKANPLMSSLCLATAYKIVRANLIAMRGFGWIANPASMQNLSKTSKYLLLGLGVAVYDQHRVEGLLEDYRRVERPCSKQYSKISTEIRDFAARQIVPDAPNMLPAAPSEFASVSVRIPMVEQAFDTLMRDIGAPSEPAPEILRAWSETRFLPSKPHPGALVGCVAPFPPPFRRNTL